MIYVNESLDDHLCRIKKVYDKVALNKLRKQGSRKQYNLRQANKRRNKYRGL